jgi:hypothetical protein
MMRKSMTVCVVLAGLTSPAWAVPIAYDGFESYGSGADLSGLSAGSGSPGPGGEFGWTSEWTAVPGVSVAGAAPVGQRTAQINGATNNIVAATRSFAPQTGTVYFSVSYRVVAGLEGSDFVHFYLGNNPASNGNTGGFGDIDTTLTNFGARIGTTNGGDTTNTTIPSIAAATYLLVGKISKTSGGNYNRVDLFVNPISTIEPALPDATDLGDAGIGTLSHFSVRSFNLDVDDIYQFDDVRIGTTFADVVPEPGSIALLGIAAGGLLTTRRRR